MWPGAQLLSAHDAVICMYQLGIHSAPFQISRKLCLEMHPPNLSFFNHLTLSQAGWLLELTELFIANSIHDKPCLVSELFKVILFFSSE